MQTLRSRSFRRVLASLLLLSGLAVFAAACSSSSNEPGIHVLTIDGAVNPVLERYIERGIDDAEAANAPLIIIEMDTPGGLDSSMRAIIQQMTDSSVPIAVYVTPPGARAGSAGTFITMAAQIAAMAPGTNIGAAAPIAADGGDIEGTLGEKVENDAAAFIRSLAELRGRNADWAESAVRDAASYTAEEALAAGAIDLISPTINQLVASIDGWQVDVPGGTTTLALTGEPLVRNEMSFFEEFLYAIADPNIAFLLLSLGALGIMIEFLNPGLTVPGALGVLCLVLAFFALGNLDANMTGVVLVLVAFALIILDIFVPSFGLLTIAGVISLIIGGLLLTGGEDGEQVSLWLIGGMTAAIVAVSLSLASLLIRTRKKLAQVGAEPLMGKIAVARTRIANSGFVFIEGERWSATTDGEPIEEGERVVIDKLEGLRLKVRRAPRLDSPAREKA